MTGVSPVYPMKRRFPMADWLPLISDFGFPAAVTLFLLYRIEAKLDQVIRSIETMAAKMEQP